MLRALLQFLRKEIRLAFGRNAAALAAASLCLASAMLIASRAAGQEPPYFVTYSHALEEPGNLEVEMKGTTASPRNGNQFLSGTLELEYGATAWWTTEVYLTGQTTANDSTIFNGFRWENRFRPLASRALH